MTTDKMPSMQDFLRTAAVTAGQIFSLQVCSWSRGMPKECLRIRRGCWKDMDTLKERGQLGEPPKNPYMKRRGLPMVYSLGKDPPQVNT